MIIKNKKKLHLAKLTISNLNSNEQKVIKGGNITNSCPDFGCTTYLPQCTTGCLSIAPRYCVSGSPQFCPD